VHRIPVDEHVAERQREGFDVSAPLTERQYSGKFKVRTSPALHARLAAEAAEQNVSMNQWVVQKLADRPITSLPDWFRCCVANVTDLGYPA
jgi:predicted HicB family RNase H-like nuclease